MFLLVRKMCNRNKVDVKFSFMLKYFLQYFFVFIFSPSPSFGSAFLLWPLLALRCRFFTLGVCDSTLFPGDPPGPVHQDTGGAPGCGTVEGAEEPITGW